MEEKWRNRMLLFPQMVEVRWNNNIKAHYVKCGYSWTKNGDTFKVYVLDLLPTSPQKIKVICDYCNGYCFKAYKDYNLSEGKDCCNRCRGKKSGEGKIKYTIEDVKHEFDKRDFYLLEDNYLGMTIHHKYECKKCGFKHSMTFKNLLKDRRCKRCSKEKTAETRRKTLESVIKEFEKENCILLTKKYKGAKQLLDYICSCGNFDQKTFNHFTRGQRCKKCGSKRRAENSLLNFVFVETTFQENGYILLEDSYVGSQVPLKFMCACGNIDTILFASRRNGIRCKECSIKLRSGEKHWNYNFRLTQEERIIGRRISGYSTWRLAVYKRDNYTCQCCGYDKGGNLNAHHLDGYSWCKEKRLDVNNGITLCDNCHILDGDSFHKSYGIKNNTKEQFIEWMMMKMSEGYFTNPNSGVFYCSQKWGLYKCQVSYTTTL